MNIESIVNVQTDIVKLTVKDESSKLSEVCEDTSIRRSDLICPIRYPHIPMCPVLNHPLGSNKCYSPGKTWRKILIKISYIL